MLYHLEEQTREGYSYHLAARLCEQIETKHGVYRDVIRQVLLSNPRVRRVGKGTRRKGEHLYAAYGQTEAGRYLVIFFIHKLTNEALLISVRDMDSKERRRYGRK